MMIFQRGIVDHSVFTRTFCKNILKISYCKPQICIIIVSNIRKGLLLFYTEVKYNSEKLIKTRENPKNKDEEDRNRTK